MGYARMKISYEVLRTLMNLPPSCKIVGSARDVPDPSLCEFLVEDPNISDDKGKPVEVRALFATAYNAVAVFNGWEPIERQDAEQMTAAGAGISPVRKRTASSASSTDRA